MDSDQFADETLADSEIDALAQRISVEADPLIDRHFPAKVDSETVLDCKGTPDNPMSAEELTGKVQSVASLVMDSCAIEDLIECVDGIEQLGSVREPTGLLGRSAPRRR